MRPTTPSSRANFRVRSRISSRTSPESRYGGSTQAESPECTPASSMCCMMPPMTTSVPSREGVHVGLEGVLEEAVHQHRMVIGRLEGLLEVPGQRLLVVDDAHGAPAQDVGGPYQHREADAAGDLQRFLLAGGDAVVRHAGADLAAHLGEAVPVLGPVDGVHRRSKDGGAVAFQSLRQLEGCLPAELDDDALAASPDAGSRERPPA